MFSHVMLGANDVAVSKKFYDAALGALGVAPGIVDGKGRAIWMTKTGLFMITAPINGEPACGANGATLGFAAETTEAAAAFHAAGLANGGTAIEDAPGVRGEGSAMPMFLAYLRDPAGNKICALKRM